MHAYQTLYIAGHKLAVLALNPEAEGEPIILLHGISNSVGGWWSDTTFRALGRCYALSLPGHYPAAFPPQFDPKELTTELIAELLAKAIQRIAGEQPVTLVGFSTGGYAALAIAALHPTQIRRVVCIAGFARGIWTGPLGDWQRLARGNVFERWWLQTAFRVFTRLSLRRFMRGSIWQKSVGRTSNIYANPLLRPYALGLYPYVRHLNTRSLQQYCAVMPAIDMSHLLPQISVPTLVFYGSADPIVPPAQSRLIASRVPQATLVELVGAGHLVMLEQPVEYTQIINSWMKESCRIPCCGRGRA